MKKHIIRFTLLVFLASSTSAFAQKIKTEEMQKNYTEVIILEKGVKRKINIPKDDKIKNTLSPYSAKEATSQEGIIVSFKKLAQISISEFETRYGLKFKTKLVIGYYIFQNISEHSDIQIVEDIMKNETNIETVKPNWKMKNTPR